MFDLSQGTNVHFPPIPAATDTNRQGHLVELS